MLPLRSQMDVAKRQKASFRERDFPGPIQLAMGGSMADDFGVYDKSDVIARVRLLSSPFRPIAA
jgi:hypothetical protein